MAYAWAHRPVFYGLSPRLDSPRARVNLVPAGNTGKDPVFGELYLTETAAGGVYISGKILGLEPGNHGFHVHAVGDLGNDCKNAGGHFNPQMVTSIWASFSYPDNIRGPKLFKK